MTKNLFLVLFIGFVLFWLFQDPSGLADSVSAVVSLAWNAGAGLFEAALDFVKAL